MANPFKPTAGATPPLLVGRQAVLAEFSESLDDGPGAPGLLTLMTGARGVGKTVMLTELGDVARTAGWVVVDDTARPGLMERLQHQVRTWADEADPPRGRLTSASVTTALVGGSMSRDLPPRDDEAWRTTVGRLLDALPSGQGLLLTVDEVHAVAHEDLTALAAEVQHLIREDRPIALAMAGLPTAVDDLLNKDVATFLRRAERVMLGEVSLPEVADALRTTMLENGRTIDDSALASCADATGGYPFMIQLVGYHVWRRASGDVISEADVADGVAAARVRLGNLVHGPALNDLSDVDRTFLVHMAQDDGPSRISDIAQRMSRGPQYVGVYRDRLLAAGMIRSVRRGVVDLDPPYLREYLREHATHLLHG